MKQTITTIFKPNLKVNINPVNANKRAARGINAPAMRGSGQGSNHMVNCMQPYLVFDTRGCF